MEEIMTWTWRLEDTDGSVVTGPASPEHPTQADAESWVGEQWRDLRDAGVAQVTLLDGPKVVYGPMSLSE
jgi:hypothetical protein